MIFAWLWHNPLKLYWGLVILRKISYFRAVVDQMFFKRFQMKLSDALEEKLLDVRLRDKLLEQGKISKKQVDEYLKSLEDSTSKSQSQSQTDHN